MSSSATAQTGNPQSWFLFSSDWKPLWAFFDSVATMRGDEASFTARYGPFNDVSAVRALTGAIADIAKVATAFGNTDSAKRSIPADPQLLLAPEPPVEAYAHLLWLCGQIQNAAATISGTLGTLSTVVDPSNGDAAARAVLLDQVFNGRGGVVETARSTAARISEFRARLAPYPARLKADVQAIAGINVANEANQTIGTLQSAIARETGQLAQMEEKAGGWHLGKRPSADEIEALRTDIAAKQSSLNAKKSFTADFNNFFPLASPALAALPNLDGRLALILNAFNDVASRLADVTRISSKDQLSDFKWLSTALNLPATIALWNSVQAAAQQFTQQGLVSG